MNIHELFGKEYAFKLTGEHYVSRDHSDGGPYWESKAYPDSFGDLAHDGSIEALKPEEVWYVHEYLSGGDYSGSSLVSKANAKVILDWLEERDGDELEDLVVEISGSYGGFGVAIRGDVDDEKLLDMLRSLSDYPLLNEETHSELEIEAQSEDWKSWARADFEHTLERRFGYFLVFEDEDTLFKLFDTACQRTNDYWVNESGVGMWINVDRVARAVHQNEVEQFLPHPLRRTKVGRYVYNGCTYRNKALAWARAARD